LQQTPAPVLGSIKRPIPGAAIQDKENGMAFASRSGNPMVDINVTPLVDVMLVLLIIFMLAVPVLSHPIQVDLPQPGPRPPQPVIQPEPIRIHIDAGNSISWNGSVVSLSSLQQRFDAESLRARMASGAVDASMQPTIQIETDSNADYDALAKVLSRARNADLLKIDFVGTAPKP
jgi:biopolymer transport protein ExbD